MGQQLLCRWDEQVIKSRLLMREVMCRRKLALPYSTTFATTMFKIFPFSCSWHCLIIFSCVLAFISLFTDCYLPRYHWSGLLICRRTATVFVTRLCLVTLLLKQSSSILPSGFSILLSFIATLQGTGKSHCHFVVATFLIIVLVLLMLGYDSWRLCFPFSSGFRLFFELIIVAH